MGCMDSGGSESERQSQTQTETKTPEQKAGIKQALDLYLPFLGQGTEIFGDSRVSPFSTLQTGAITAADPFIDFFSEPKQVGTPLFDETGDALKGLLSGQTGAQNLDPGDFFERSIEAPTMRRLREDVLPGIDEDFAGPGFFGSARSQERTDRRQETAEFLDESQAAFDYNIALNNQGLAESRAGRAQTAIGQGIQYGQVPAQEIMNNLTIASQQIGGLASIFGIGQAEQTQEQAILTDEIMKFAEANQITDPENLSIILSLLGMNFTQSSSSSYGSSSSSGPGLGYLAVGGAASQAGQNLGNKFFPA